MTTRTILAVREQTNRWDGGKQPAEFITIVFEPLNVGDEPDEGSVYSTVPDVAKHKAALAALIGKPGEFDLEAKDDYNGVKQWKVKTYPGQPARSGGNQGNQGKGGGNWESAEERAVKNASIESQVATDKAALVAVALIGKGGEPADLDEWAEAIVKAGEAIAGGIRAGVKPRQVPASASQPTAQTEARHRVPWAQPAEAQGSAGGAATDGEWRNRALAEYGGVKALKDAFEVYFGTPTNVNDMSGQQLAELLIFRAEQEVDPAP